MVRAEKIGLVLSILFGSVYLVVDMSLWLLLPIGKDEINEQINVYNSYCTLISLLILSFMYTIVIIMLN